jgi:3-methyl-2-oxobutanoate hydroxymethyltransferase
LPAVPAAPSDRLAVTLAGLRFHARVGVLPHEREVPQPLEVDVTAWPAARAAVLDYRALYDAAAGAVAAEPLAYLEDVADDVAARVLSAGAAARVRVAVRKPHVAMPGRWPTPRSCSSATRRPRRECGRARVRRRRGARDRAGRRRPRVERRGPRDAPGGRARAIGHLPRTRIVATSTVEETAPVGPAGQGPYLNQMLRVETLLAPHALLDRLLDAEAAAGRVRDPALRWGRARSTATSSVSAIGSCIPSGSRFHIRARPPRLVAARAGRARRRVRRRHPGSGAGRVSQAAGSAPAKRVTTHAFASARTRGERLVMVTAYDALFARLVDDAGVDAILVGDSLGNVVAGYDTTVPVTLDQMIYHGAAVRPRRVARARDRRHAVPDLSGDGRARGTQRRPRHAGDALRRGEARGRLARDRRHGARARPRRHPRHGPPRLHAAVGPPARRLPRAGARRGRRDAPRRRGAPARGGRGVRRGARTRAGPVAARVREAVAIPTIGIGAGAECDGQVLVLHDLLGLTDGFSPKFLRRYAALAGEVRGAVSGFAADVRGAATGGRARLLAAGPMLTVTTAADLRAALRGRRRAPSDSPRPASRSCRRWAPCTPATSRSSTRRGGAPRRS